MPALYRPVGPPQLASVRSLDDLALALGLPNYLALASKLYPAPAYRSFLLSKRAGGYRRIESPPKWLKALQRRLATDLLDFYGVPRSSVHGFVRHRSVLTNAEEHARPHSILHVDIEDFFGSIHFGRVRGLFMASPFGFPKQIAIVLAHICCTNGRLAQGAPTSPIISNFICRTLDSKLAKLARECRVSYTRYADDLTFSQARPRRHLLHERLVSTSGAHPTLSEEFRTLMSAQGFVVNDAKTRIDYPNARKLVTGLVVNEFPNVPREYFRKVRAALYVWEKYGFKSAAPTILKALHKRTYRSGRQPNACKVIWGKLQYMRMVKGEHDSPLISLVQRYERLTARDAADIGGASMLGIRTDPTVVQAKDARSATWFVEAIDAHGNPNEGSAFLVRGVGFITCAHCISDYSDPAKPFFSPITLHSHDRKFSVSVAVHKFDRDLDLAILTPTTPLPPALHLAFRINAALPTIGQHVVVCGYPDRRSTWTGANRG
jgi:RNA-directed DNA polymerase